MARQSSRKTRSKRRGSNTRTSKNPKGYSALRSSKPVNRTIHKSKSHRNGSKSHRNSRKHRRNSKKLQHARANELIKQFHTIHFKCGKEPSDDPCAGGLPAAGSAACQKYTACKQVRDAHKKATSRTTVPWPKVASIGVYPLMTPLPCPGAGECATEDRNDTRASKMCRLLQKKCDARSLGARDVSHLFLAPR